MGKDSKTYLYLIFVALGFIFLRSGWGKVEGGKFVGALGQTLTKFAEKNPFPFYKDFLQNVAIPNSTLFGILTMWGEVLAGLVLLLIPLYLIFTKNNTKGLWLLLTFTFLVGMLLNGTFWLAAGHTSPSTDGLNLVMFIIEALGFTFSLKQLSAAKA